MSMGIVRLRIEAKENRSQACLKYIKTRTTPVTLKELASKLNMTTKAISNSLMPLLDQGLIKRELIKRQSSICKKLGWAYGYLAVDTKYKTLKKSIGGRIDESLPDGPSWNNPFNISYSTRRRS